MPLKKYEGELPTFKTLITKEDEDGEINYVALDHLGRVWIGWHFMGDTICWQKYRNEYVEEES